MSVFHSLEALGHPEGCWVQRAAWDKQVGVTGKWVFCSIEDRLSYQQSPSRIEEPGSVGSELSVTRGMQLEVK